MARVAKGMLGWRKCFRCISTLSLEYTSFELCSSCLVGPKKLMTWTPDQPCPLKLVSHVVMLFHSRDSVVNQLLAKMDGVQPLAVPTLVIGLTNKRSLIEPGKWKSISKDLNSKFEMVGLTFSVALHFDFFCFLKRFCVRVDSKFKLKYLHHEQTNNDSAF